MRRFLLMFVVILGIAACQKEDFADELAAAELEIAQQERQIANLQQEINDLTSELNTANNTIADLEVKVDEIEDLNLNIEELNQEIADLEAQIAALSGNEDAIAALHAQIASLQAALDAVEAEVEIIEVEVPTYITITEVVTVTLVETVTVTETIYITNTVTITIEVPAPSNNASDTNDSNPSDTDANDDDDDADNNSDNPFNAATDCTYTESTEVSSSTFNQYGAWSGWTTQTAAADVATTTRTRTREVTNYSVTTTVTIQTANDTRCPLYYEVNGTRFDRVTNQNTVNNGSSTETETEEIANPNYDNGYSGAGDSGSGSNGDTDSPQDVQGCSFTESTSQSAWQSTGITYGEWSEWTTTVTGTNGFLTQERSRTRVMSYVATVTTSYISYTEGCSRDDTYETITKDVNMSSEVETQTVPDPTYVDASGHKPQLHQYAIGQNTGQNHLTYHFYFNTETEADAFIAKNYSALNIGTGVSKNINSFQKAAAPNMWRVSVGFGSKFGVYIASGSYIQFEL